MKHFLCAGSSAPLLLCCTETYLYLYVYLYLICPNTCLEGLPYLKLCVANDIEP